LDDYPSTDEEGEKLSKENLEDLLNDDDMDTDKVEQQVAGDTGDTGAGTPGKPDVDMDIDKVGQQVAGDTSDTSAWPSGKPGGDAGSGSSGPPSNIRPRSLSAASAASAGGQSSGDSGLPRAYYNIQAARRSSMLVRSPSGCASQVKNCVGSLKILTATLQCTLTTGTTTLRNRILALHLILVLCFATLAPGEMWGICHSTGRGRRLTSAISPLWSL
jgi:hypothetical protein